MFAKCLSSPLLLAVLSVLLSPFIANAQIFESRANIISEHGEPFEEGKTDFYTSITYITEYNLEGIEPFSRIKTIYFFPSDGEEICYAYKVYDPISHLESTIDYCNKHYRRLSDIKWRDPETSMVYLVGTYEEFCTIIVRWGEDEK
jgi:hypothetical protein